MTSKKIISVFGATGNQGSSVVRAFLNDQRTQSDWAVRGITRNATSDMSKNLTSQGVEVISADVSDKASLVHAMKGASAVFAVTNYWEKMDMKLEIQQGKNLADAAKEAGVNHFVWSSLLNVNKLTNGKLPNVYHFDSKAIVEDYVRELGIPATFVLPGFYMSNIPGNMMRKLPPDDAWTLALPVPETAPFPLIATEDDIGKWVKAIVLKRDEPGMLGRRVYAASAYVTAREMVETFRRTFPEAGKTARFLSLPHDQYLKTLTGLGLPQFGAEELLENMRLMDEGGYFGGEDLTHDILEDRLTTWEEFIRRSPAFKDLK